MGEFASRGMSGTALGLGIGGTALGLLNGGLGLFGNGANNATKDDVEHAKTIAEKDSEIALLKSEKNTDSKLVEVYVAAAERDKTIRKEIQDEVKELRNEIRANYDAQSAVNLQQAVYNGTNTATLGCMQNSINQLMGLTQLRIPNTAVCPGWGNVTVTPSTTTTTT